MAGERGAKIVIDANDKKVNMRHEDVTKDINKTSVVQTGREYVVNPALAKDLLEEIGILAKNGKIKNDKIRKYNQIDYFVELMRGCVKKSVAGTNMLFWTRLAVKLFVIRYEFLFERNT